MAAGAPKKPDSEKKKWTSARIHLEDYHVFKKISKKLGKSIVDTVHIITTEAKEKHKIS